MNSTQLNLNLKGSVLDLIYYITSKKIEKRRIFFSVLLKKKCFVIT